MCLLDFVEQYHRVGFASYRFRQLSPFIIAYVSGRRSDQSRYAVLLLILAHVDTCHHRLVIKEELCQRLGQLGLTYTGCTQEEERSDRPLGILQSGTTAAYSICYGLNGLVLSDDPLVKLLLQVEQLLLFALQHLANRYAGPARNDIGNIFCIHLLFDHGVITLHLVQLLLRLLYLLVQGLQLAVANLGYAAVVALTFSLFGFKLQVFNLHLVLLDLVDQALLTLPFSFVGALLFLQLSQFLPNLFQLLRIVFAFDGFAFNLQLLDFTRNLIQLFRHTIHLHAELGSRLVHQVDGLIRQESIGDVAVTQLHGRYDGVVFDTHVVVVLVALLQSTQDRDGAQRIGLIDHHNLEASFQGLILLEVLLILVQGGGTNAAQFAAGQSWLQDIGCIHGPFSLARTHQGVYLVDKEDDVALALLHLVDDRLESFLKLTLVLGSSHQGTHVERIDLLVLEVLGHVASQDTVGQTLYNGGLTRTRLTNQDRVVLGPSAQDLQHATYLFVTSNHGVQFATTSCFAEVDGIFLQRLVGIFARLRGHLLAFTQFVDGGTQLFLGHAGILQNGRSGALHAQ